MTYVVISAVYALVVAFIVWRALTTLSTVSAQAADERRRLEDRLIAMTDLDASVLVHATERPVEGDVTYVDEAKEWELDHGN